MYCNKVYAELQSQVDKVSEERVSALVNRLNFYVFSGEITRGEHKSLCRRLCKLLLKPGKCIFFNGRFYKVYRLSGTSVYTEDGMVIDGPELMVKGQFCTGACS